MTVPDDLGILSLPGYPGDHDNWSLVDVDHLVLTFALVASALALTIFASALAQIASAAEPAQQAPAPESPPALAAADEGIVVTGSRIPAR